MAARTLEELLVVIEASTTGLRQELNRSVADVRNFEQKIGAHTKNVESRFGALSTGVIGLRSAIGALGIGIGVAGLASLAKGALEAGASVKQAAELAGLSVDRFQRLQRVFADNSVSSDQFREAMARLNRGLGEFLASGGGETATAIKLLGLEAKVAGGEIRTAEQFFNAAVEALDGIESEATKAAAASKLFGDAAGQQMLQAMKLGVAGLEEAQAAVRGVFSEEQVELAARFNAGIERIASTLSTKLKGAFLDLAGVMGQAFPDRSTLSAVTAEIQELEQRIERLPERGRAGARARLGELREQQASMFARQLRADAAASAGGGNAGQPDWSAIAQEAQSRTTELAQALNTIWRDAESAEKSHLDKLRKDLADETRRFADELDAVDDLTIALQEEAARYAEAEKRVLDGFTLDLAEEQARVASLFDEAGGSFDAFVEKLDGRAVGGLGAFGESLGDALQSTLANAFLGVETNFSDMLRRMAAEYAASELVRALSTAFGGSSGGGGPLSQFLGGLFGGARASGGPVQAGKAYLVGEKRPELFIPDVSGTIANIAPSRSATPPVLNVTLVNTTGQPMEAAPRNNGGPGGQEIVLSLLNQAGARGGLDQIMKSRYGIGPVTGLR